MRVQTLLLALCLSACGEALPAPAAVPVAPRRVESGAEAPVEAQAVVLVAPGQLSSAVEAPLVEAPAAVSEQGRPAAAPPTPSVRPTANSTEQVVKVKGAPLARDRKGKIMGRGPTRDNRPDVNMGMPSGKFSTPFRGRKIRNREARNAKREAAKEAQQETAQEPAGEASGGEPRR